MVGHKLLEVLIERGATADWDIVTFCEEGRPAYDRVGLSSFFNGTSAEELSLVAPGFFDQFGLTIHVGDAVASIDRVAGEIVSTKGLRIGYDALVLATGSYPFVPPVPGKDTPGCFVYRTLDDLEAIRDYAVGRRVGAVVGGGLLGLEAANGLMLRGMHVTVVHIGEWLLERQLDKTSGQLLQAALEARGLQFRLREQTLALHDAGTGRVGSIEFKNGDILPADLVVMAAGIRPRTELAEKSGLPCNRGILVNDTMQTYDPRIYAIGECASHRGIAYGLVAPLFEQAKVCANHLAQLGFATYKGSVTSTKLKVTGIDLFSAGDFLGGEGTETITLCDPISGIYKKLVIKGDVLVGACLYGDTADGGWYLQKIRENHGIGPIRDHLMFGAQSIVATVDEDDDLAPVPLQEAS